MLTSFVGKTKTKNKTWLHYSNDHNSRKYLEIKNICYLIFSRWQLKTGWKVEALMLNSQVAQWAGVVLLHCCRRLTCCVVLCCVVQLQVQLTWVQSQTNMLHLHSLVLLKNGCKVSASTSFKFTLSFPLLSYSLCATLSQTFNNNDSDWVQFLNCPKTFFNHCCESAVSGYSVHGAWQDILRASVVLHRTQRSVCQLRRKHCWTLEAARTTFVVTVTQ